MERIFDKLYEHELNPYFVGQHEGICEEDFVIVKDDGILNSINSNRLGQNIVDIILFVPIYDYTRMETYEKQVKNALKELGYLRSQGFKTPVIADDEKKAYTTSMRYVLQKKLEG